jgi:hypothetical protein
MASSFEDLSYDARAEDLARRSLFRDSIPIGCCRRTLRQPCAGENQALSGIVDLQV